MSEPAANDARAGAGSVADRGELEAPASTVRLDDLFAIVRRHIRLVLGVAAAVVAAAGYVAFVTGPVYRAVAVIRLSDPRRALTGGVVDDPARADDRFTDPVLSQVELLKSGTVAGAVVDSMPMLRVRTRKFPANLLGEVVVPAEAGADSLQVSFGRDSFVATDASGRQSAAYAAAVAFGGIRFAILRRPDGSQGRLRVLSRDAAIHALLTQLRVKPRIRTDIVDVAYAAPDPRVAQQVVNRVVDGFRSASAAA